jgi:hypothetical protein
MEMMHGSKLAQGLAQGLGDWGCGRLGPTASILFHKRGRNPAFLAVPLAAPCLKGRVEGMGHKVGGCAES